MKPIRRDYFPRIEQFITEYREANGTAPSIKEIAAYLNVCNTTAWRYIQRMASEGLLDYQGGYGRISTISSLKESEPSQAIPSVGSISCGLPLLAEENIEERADLLFRELWCNNDRLLFPETAGVLEYFHRHGFKMGVISDTSPSLEYTLQQLGIAEYFSSFTASSLVGAGKPSPVIFNAALDSLGVTAEESIYVDDYPPEADGARALGFTSFLIDRKAETAGEWTITSLQELISFIESIGGPDI